MNRIKELRKIYNLNQTELAEKLNTTQQTISNWENGITDIDIDTLLLISNTFDLSVDYILGKTYLTIGERIKQLRVKNNLTQIEFAKIFKISNGTIAMWETNKRQPGYNTLIKIADYFNVSVDYLLGRDYKNNCTITKNNYYNTKVDYILDKTNNLQLKNEDITMDKPLNILIKTAQGNRTQNSFALDCGIDSSSLTRILNGENTPKPEILKKISVKAQNNVSYTDLMIAAGFIDINEIKEYFANEHKTNLLETNINNSLIVVKNNKIQSFQFSDNEIDAILLLLNKFKN